MTSYQNHALLSYQRFCVTTGEGEAWQRCRVNTYKQRNPKTLIFHIPDCWGFGQFGLSVKRNQLEPRRPLSGFCSRGKRSTLANGSQPSSPIRAKPRKNGQSQTERDVLAEHKRQSQSRSSGCDTATLQEQCFFLLFVTETYESILTVPNAGWVTLPGGCPPCDRRSKAWAQRSPTVFSSPVIPLLNFQRELQRGCSCRASQEYLLTTHFFNENTPRPQ